MRKCMLACVTIAIIGCYAVQASAQETIKAPSGSTVSKTEIQTSPAPRTGILGRRGDRRDNGVVTIVSPTTTTTTTPVEPAPMTITTAQVNEPRTGLLARLRGRLGR